MAHDVLDNGICVDCPPEDDHELVDGICESCSDAQPMGGHELALVAALEELAGKTVARAAFDPGKHPRNPKGSPGGGRFRSLVDRLKDAIEAHHKGKGEGHPFDGFDREQLRRVAKARGITLKRGEARDSIAAKLLADLHATEKPKPELKPKTVGRHAGRDITGDVDFKSLPATYNPKTNENDALKAIIARQGFDGHPKVVSVAEFDKAHSGGEVRETWRGITAPITGRKPEELAEQYRNGDFHTGLGINGDGTYVAMNKADGQYYGSTLLRIGLRKDARVISAADLDAEMDKFFAADRRKSAELRRLDEKLIKDLATARTERARANIRRKYRNDVDGLDPDRSIALQRDPSIFAALRGYDAIEIPKHRSPDTHHEMIILNRTATIVQEA